MMGLGKESNGSEVLAFGDAVVSEIRALYDREGYGRGCIGDRFVGLGVLG